MRWILVCSAALFVFAVSLSPVGTPGLFSSPGTAWASAEEDTEEVPGGVDFDEEDYDMVENVDYYDAGDGEADVQDEGYMETDEYEELE